LLDRPQQDVQLVYGCRVRLDDGFDVLYYTSVLMQERDRVDAQQAAICPVNAFAAIEQPGGVRADVLKFRVSLRGIQLGDFNAVHRGYMGNDEVWSRRMFAVRRVVSEDFVDGCTFGILIHPNSTEHA